MDPISDNGDSHNRAHGPSVEAPHRTNAMKKQATRPTSGISANPKKSSPQPTQLSPSTVEAGKSLRFCENPGARNLTSKRDIIKEDNIKGPSTASTIARKPVQKHNNFMEPQLGSKKSSPKFEEKPSESHRKKNLDSIYLPKTTRQLLSLATKIKNESPKNAAKKGKHGEPLNKTSSEKGQRPHVPQRRLTRSKSPISNSAQAKKEKHNPTKTQRLKSTDTIREKDIISSDTDANLNKYSSFGGKSELISPEELIVVHDVVETPENEGVDLENIKEEVFSDKDDDLTNKVHSDNIFSNFSITSSLTALNNRQPPANKHKFEPVVEENFILHTRQSLEGVNSSQESGSNNARFSFLDKSLEQSFLETMNKGMRSPTFQREQIEPRTFSPTDGQKRSGTGNEDVTIDLVFDGVLDCYYDPKTQTYYNLKI